MSKHISSFNLTSTSLNSIFNANVGIGTTNVSAKLHVHAPNSELRLSAGTSEPTAFTIINSNGSGQIGIAGNTSHYSTDAVASDVIIRSNTGKLLLQYGGAASAICINTSNNVGMGTNNPLNRLTIRQDQNAFSTIEIRNNNTTSNTSGSQIVFGSFRDNNPTDYEGAKIRAIHVDSEFGSAVKYADLAFYTQNNITDQFADERMRIKSGGNVGIGTTNPTSLLHVFSNTSSTNLLIESTNSSALTITSSTNASSIELHALTSNFCYIDFGNGNDYNARILVNNSTQSLAFSTGAAGTTKMTILSSGNVGIGTANPTQQLHVQLDALIAGGDLFLFDTNEKIASDGTDLFFHVNGTETVRFKSGGNIGIGITSPTQQLHVRNDALIAGGNLFLFDTNEEIGSDGTDLFFKVNGVETVRFKSDGNIGIGITSPTQQLHVRNDALIQGGNLFLVDTEEEIGSNGTDIFFKVSNAETVRFKSGGNVGIGTNNPAVKLHVLDTTTTGVIYDIARFFSSGLITGTVQLKLGKEDTIGNTGEFRYTHAGPASTSNRLGIGFHSNEVISILNSGSVGIGSITPGNTFEVRNSTFIQGLFSSSASSGGIKLKNNTGQEWELQSIVTTNNFGIVDRNLGGVVRLSIRTNGNVGLNQSTPVCVLHTKQFNENASGNLTSDDMAGFVIERSGDTTRWGMSVNSGNDLTFQYWNKTSWAEKGYMLDTSSAAQMNFTGQHRTFGHLHTSHVGLIVVSSGQYYNITEGITSIPTINESLPCVELAIIENDKRVFGVLSDKEDTNDTRDYAWGNFVSVYPKNGDPDRIIINSLGEGGIWVCNKDGSYENGDYITTCTVPGYGTKQSDDLLHNYTVAKITQDENFTDMTIGITTGITGTYYERARYLDSLGNLLTLSEYNLLLGVTTNVYKAKFVGCTYHCG